MARLYNVQFLQSAGASRLTAARQEPGRRWCDRAEQRPPPQEHDMTENFRMHQLVARERAREIERNARHGWRRTSRRRERKRSDS